MKLKSLDIHGFKSFAERTKLDFNDGITAVIGPNGSGKSNIADAVRWVLGEQSTKTLRGGKMEDVIFSGTQGRKGQGVASVTLVIDNIDRTMAGVECDEVAITRKLYRSGDSEYRLNGAQVRLKDINELFMDTGLGRDGYSIIGQGRVAEIVSARSKERREIFEEAAGISKFRYRKTEAERRLNLAEDNLVRLRDILQELDNRIGPLKTQSEKAHKFLELAAQRKTLEISVWLKSLSALRGKTATLEDKLIIAQNDYNAADNVVKECEEIFSQQTQKNRELTILIEEQRNAIATLKGQATEAQGNIAVLENDIRHHNATIDEINEQLKNQGGNEETANLLIEKAREQLLQHTQKLEELENQKTDATFAVNAALDDQHELESQLEILRSRRAGAFEAIEKARLDSVSAHSVLGESLSRIENMEQERNSRQMAVDSAKAQIIECEKLLEEVEEEIKSLENAAKGYILKRDNRGEKAQEIQKQVQELENKVNEKLQRAKLLLDMDKNMEGFGHAIKLIMAKARAGAIKGIYGPVSTLISTQDEYTLAIETALGAAMQNIVVDNEETGKRGIAALKQEKAGRATFLPVSTVKGNRIDATGAENMFGYVGVASDLVKTEATYQGVITSLLGRTVIAEDLDSAVIIAKKNGYRFRIVTLDGQVVNAGGSMTGGYSARSAGILGRQGEIEKLNQEAAKLKEQLLGTIAQREEILKELAQVNAEISSINARKQTCNEDKIRASTEKNSATGQLVQANQQLAQFDTECEELSRRLEEIKKQSENSTQLAKELTAELDLLQQEIATKADALAALKANQAESLENANALQTQIMLCQRDITSSQEEINRLIEQRDNTQRYTNAQMGRIEQLKLQITQANKKIEALRNDIVTYEQNAVSTEQATKQTMLDREQVEKATAELRVREREATTKREELNRELAKLTEQKAQADSERESFIAKLYDEYELTLTQAEEIAQEIEDISMANRELLEIKNRIRALGSVNVDAIEEYKEVALRHGELTTQLSDVERSKAELTRLINELTVQMCEIFSEKFSAINRNFSTTFRELFEGGSASLSLTNPEDVLESGIEINVNPPGKLIKNLAALSGGEQSFVAIAIFFSILKVNPSPFCLMDEIEAALDDVNVSRFASYLRTLTEKTQFIAITHRRGTMEEADILYGVTMQEEGVSKLLALEVSEIEKSMGVK